MASSNKALNDKIRAYYLEKVKEFFADIGEEVLVTGSGEICMPCVDAEGNEKWVQFVVKVPTGTHDGEPFDGYSLAEDYEMKLHEKAEKAKEAARKKAEKMGDWLLKTSKESPNDFGEDETLRIYNSYEVRNFLIL